MPDLPHELASDTQATRPGILKVEQTSDPCLWLLVSLCVDWADDAGFSMDGFFCERGINRADVPFVGRLRSQESFDLVIHHSFLDALMAKLHDFVVEGGYNPTLPTAREIGLYGACEAQRYAEAAFLDNAAEAVSYRWGLGPAQCYHATARNNDLSADLELWIVVRYLLVNTHAHPATTISLTALRTPNCPGKWACQQLLHHRGRKAADQSGQRGSHRQGRQRRRVAFAQEETLKRQTAMLLRQLVAFSGSEVMPRQRPFEPGNVEFSPRRNATVYGRVFGVDGSEPFGQFDPEAMHSALLKSELFLPDSEETATVNVLDAARWRNRMLTTVPIGVPDNFSVRYSCPSNRWWLIQISQFRRRFSTTSTSSSFEMPNILCQSSPEIINITLTTGSCMFYYQTPSLRVPTNDYLLLLLWGPRFFGNTLRALSDWAQSNDGQDFSQLLIREVLKQQPAAQLALTLAAFLSFERLRSYSPGVAPSAVGQKALKNLHAVLETGEGAFKRTLLAQMASLASEYLSVPKPYAFLAQSIDVLLDPPPPAPSDELRQYTRARMAGQLSHHATFEALLQAGWLSTREQAKGATTNSPKNDDDTSASYEKTLDPMLNPRSEALTEWNTVARSLAQQMPPRGSSNPSYMEGYATCMVRRDASAQLLLAQIRYSVPPQSVQSAELALVQQVVSLSHKV